MDRPPRTIVLMRPLFHPATDDITVEGILHALADPVRVQIFAEIAKAQCPQACSAFLEVSDRTVPKSTLSQHFKVLREAGLIRSERHGVELRNSPRFDDLHDRFGKLLKAIMDAHIAQSKRELRSQRSSRKKASPRMA
jgi:DNA-binding transcriptional ArsR family regulator